MDSTPARRPAYSSAQFPTLVGPFCNLLPVSWWWYVSAGWASVPGWACWMLFRYIQVYKPTPSYFVWISCLKIPLSCCHGTSSCHRHIVHDVHTAIQNPVEIISTSVVHVICLRLHCITPRWQRMRCTFPTRSVQAISARSRASTRWFTKEGGESVMLTT